jgi:hypothetical protein
MFKYIEIQGNHIIKDAIVSVKHYSKTKRNETHYYIEIEKINKNILTLHFDNEKLQKKAMHKLGVK